MKIDKENVKVLCTFRCKGNKYSLVQENEVEDSYLGRGFWVVNSSKESVGCRFFDLNLRSEGIKDPLDYVKSNNFNYGLFEDLVEVDNEPSVFERTAEDIERAKRREALQNYYDSKWDGNRRIDD